MGIVFSISIVFSVDNVLMFKGLQVPIDACIVGSQHSAFLQQASHITGGIYMKPPQPEGLFQYLMVGHMQAFVLSIKFY
jgi:hypothetical protein